MTAVRARLSGGWGLALAAVLFVAILVSRRPDMLRHAEFWAEDGWEWYPVAYYHGLGSLVMPVAGYLQTVSRLVALVSLAFPLAWAPTLFMLSALVVQVLPPLLLVSRRMDDCWPSRTGRWVFALLYLTLPNTFEVFVNLTNAQWHLAVLSFLILASRAPAGRSAWVFDVVVLVVSCLSGPFAILMAPIALWHYAGRRTRAQLIRTVVVCGLAAVQGAVVLENLHSRVLGPNGASIELLTRILARQILLGATLGQRLGEVLPSWPLWTDLTIPAFVVGLGVVLAGLAFWRGPPFTRQACVFGAMLLFAEMLHPVVSDTGPQWVPLVEAGIGGRYWFIPMLVWLGVLFTLVADRLVLLRLVSGFILASAALGVWSDYYYPYMPATTFAASALAFETAAPGTSINFPVNPPGVRPMVLVK